MKIDRVTAEETLDIARKMLDKNKKISHELKAVLMVLFAMFELLLSLQKKPSNSSNSSIPPSQDPNRAKTSKASLDKKPGGQPGRKGTTLKQTQNPDQIIDVPVDQSLLDPCLSYQKLSPIKRQVIEFVMTSQTIEYRLEVLVDENGKRYTANHPKAGTRPIQYGDSLKATAVYMSMFQMIPYNRTEDFFMQKGGIPVSQGSLVNFNKEAFDRLETFENLTKDKLASCRVLHTDETGINVDGKRIWLHSASNDLWTLFAPHGARGCIAMDEIGILPKFEGVMVHDHWKPYFKYNKAQHALCNAHHLRELEKMIQDHPSHTWAKQMKEFLVQANQYSLKNGGMLNDHLIQEYQKRYKDILELGNSQCPLLDPKVPKVKGSPKKRGVIKKTKERNLLERLQNFEQETLRFMTTPDVPFTNNQGENDIRMTKVQQKISGCFKSFEGAQIFARIRSYILTCQKHGLNQAQALTTLFQGSLPDFCA